jgi:LacI family transcriptional regulator
MSRPTVNDIAKAAGVSLATVDRVLNARPGVTENTVRRVNEAIDAIGYVRDVGAANLARQRRYRVAFVIPGGPGLFVGTLRDAVAEAIGNSPFDRTEIRLVSFPPGNPHALVKALRNLGAANTDGVAIFAPETPHVRDAIAKLNAENVPIVALVSDLPNTGRDHFVGIDNVAAGRTAGFLMGRFLGCSGGAVLALAGSLQARDNVERRLGFDQVMAERFPSIETLPTLEGHDDDAVTARVVTEMLERRSDIAGIYSLGHGSRALLEVLDGMGARARGLTVIGHELTRVTRDALRAGRMDAVISQNVGHIVRSALRVLRAKSDGLDIVASQERIRIEIVVAENLA